MLDQFDKITEACATISARWPHKPAVGLILGSGLGAAAAALTDTVTIPYESIPHFAKATAHGHAGQLVCGLLAGVPVVVMEGRMHAYEGYPASQITFPVRVLGLSVITDMCLPDHLEVATVENILAVARSAEPKLRAIITAAVRDAG